LYCKIYKFYLVTIIKIKNYAFVTLRKANYYKKRSRENKLQKKFTNIHPLFTLKPQPILKFWRNVEIFNLPDFNKNTYLINPGNPLPWLQPNKPLKKNYKWRYTLVFGKIERKVVIDHLNNLLKIDDTNDWEEPVRGFICL
jgi:hypothetical protein